MHIAADRVISMRELQKLSLRKLREMKLADSPLLVRDHKRHRGMFVIVDYPAFERLAGEGAGGRVPASTEDIDFAAHGLLWDRPGMKNREFGRILSDAADPRHDWAWARVLERLPSRLVTGIVGLGDLRRIVARVKIRPRLRAAWEGALEFWTEEARRRLA